MARIATAPRFALDTRNTLSRDPRDFHHGLLDPEPPSNHPQAEPRTPVSGPTH